VRLLWAENLILNEGECVPSIVVRLAPHGKLWPTEFARLTLEMRNCQSPENVARDRGAVLRLADAAGIDPQHLVANSWIQDGATFNILGRRVPQDWVVTRTQRIAPSSLIHDAERWIRTPWQIAALPCDLSTGEVLRTRCWKCGGDLRWPNHNYLAWCGCLANQALAPFRRVPDDVLAAARDLGGLFDLGPRPLIPAAFARLDDAALFALISWFGYFGDLVDGAWLRPSAVNAAKGFQTMKQWPSSFDRVLLRSIESERPGLASISNTNRTRIMSELMLTIDRAGSPEAVAILRQRAEQVLQVPADEKTIEDIILRPALDITLREAATKSQTRRQRISAMRSSHDRTSVRARSSN
jgi:hypothetical protein